MDLIILEGCVLVLPDELVRKPLEGSQELLQFLLRHSVRFQVGPEANIDGAMRRV